MKGKELAEEHIQRVMALGKTREWAKGFCAGAFMYSWRPHYQHDEVFEQAFANLVKVENGR